MKIMTNTIKNSSVKFKSIAKFALVIITFSLTIKLSQANVFTQRSFIADNAHDLIHANNSNKVKKSYLPYYQMINEASFSEYKKDTIGALNIYIKAFKEYRGFETDYIHAIGLSLKLSMYDITYKLLKQKALNTGWLSLEELFDSIQVRLFLNNSNGKKFTKDFPKWLVKNERKYDIKSVRFMASINESDQFVRSGNFRFIKDHLKYDSLYRKIIINLSTNTDNQNFVRFKNFCEIYGYPGRSKLGGKDSYNSFIIHIFKYFKDTNETQTSVEKMKFNYLDSLLKVQIRLGEFDPNIFAYCMDYSLLSDSVSLLGRPIYYRNENGKFLLNFPLINPETINIRREAIGLMKIEDERKILNLPLPPNLLK